MDNDDDTMSGRKKQRGGLTPPPTLDLNAQEISTESPQPAAAEADFAPPAPAEPVEQAAGATAADTPPEEPAIPSPAPDVEAAIETPTSETAEAPPVEPEAAPAEAAKVEPSSEPKADQPPPPRLDIFDEPPPAAPSPRSAFIYGAVGGVIGAVLVGAAMLLIPAKQPAPPTTDATADLAPRLAGIEQDIAAARKLAEDASGKATAVESAVKSASDTAASAVNLASEAKGAAADTAEKLAQLPAQAGAPVQGGAPASVDLGPLTARLAKAEAAAKDLQAALPPLDDKASAAAGGVAEAGKRLDVVEKTLAAGPADRTAAYVVALAGIGEALREGRPFEAELAAASGIGGHPPALEPLAPLAAKGVPSAGTLSGEFDALAPKLVEALTPKAPEPPADAGVMDRFWFSIVNSGTVTHEGEAVATEPGAPIRAIADKLRHGDLAGAVADFRALPEAARTAGAGWLDEAGAALDAQALIRSETAATLQKLAKQ